MGCSCSYWAVLRWRGPHQHVVLQGDPRHRHAAAGQHDVLSRGGPQHGHAVAEQRACGSWWCELLLSPMIQDLLACHVTRRAIHQAWLTCTIATMLFIWQRLLSCAQWTCWLYWNRLEFSCSVYDLLVMRNHWYSSGGWSILPFYRMWTHWCSNSGGFVLTFFWMWNTVHDPILPFHGMWTHQYINSVWFLLPF